MTKMRKLCKKIIYPTPALNPPYFQYLNISLHQKHTCMNNKIRNLPIIYPTNHYLFSSQIDGQLLSATSRCHCNDTFHLSSISLYQSMGATHCKWLISSCLNEEPISSILWLMKRRIEFFIQVTQDSTILINNQDLTLRPPPQSFLIRSTHQFPSSHILFAPSTHPSETSWVPAWNTLPNSLPIPPFPNRSDNSREHTR